jgi:hypothetical protein
MITVTYDIQGGVGGSSIQQGQTVNVQYYKSFMSISYIVQVW